MIPPGIQKLLEEKVKSLQEKDVNLTGRDRKRWFDREMKKWIKKFFSDVVV